MGVLTKPIAFGDYFLLEKVNTGGMAEIFKAKTFGVEGFERIVAVKKILPSIAEDKEFISMFIDEAKIAVQLSHANIAQIFDLGCIDGQYYIAMEYVPGKDLRSIFDMAVQAGKRLDVSSICYIISKVCEGLDYAHNKKDSNGIPLGIVHRDISPQNILIGYEGDCKLIDFGIAKAAGKSSSTQVGILKGKFSYMSPEQVKGGDVDHRSDIFALGIVLFEMLTLKRLFLGESDFSTLEKIRKVEVSPPTLYNPNIPEELEDIVLRALEKDPHRRYQSAHEMLQSLQRFMFRQNIYYSSKDLSHYCSQAFAREIELERKKSEFYRELSRDVLEESRTALIDDEDRPTGFYDDRGLPSLAGVSFEKLSAVPLTKEAVYAELDNFVPPEDSIVYNKDLSGRVSHLEVEAVSRESQNRIPLVSASKESDSVQAMIAPRLKIDQGLPAPRKSISVVIPRTDVEKSRSDRRRRKSALPMVFAILVLLILIMSVLFLSYYGLEHPKYGMVQMNVEPADVAVDVKIGDKWIVHGLDTRPIQIDKVKSYERHSYVLSAEGYEELHGEFEVKNKPLELNLELKALAKMGLSLNVVPADALVMIDGEALEGQSPYKLFSLSKGYHKLKVVKAGYQDYESSVNIAESIVLEREVVLRAMHAKLVLDSVPSGLAYEVKELSTSKVIKGKTKAVLDELIAGETYEVVVIRDGKREVSRWTAPSDGRDSEKLVVVSVEEKVGSVGASEPVIETREEDSVVNKRVDSASVRGSHKSSSKGHKNRVKEEVGVVAAVPSSEEQGRSSEVDETNKGSEAVAKTGVLRINSKPPAEIYINGKSHGNTPRRIELNAGEYTIRFVNASQGVDEERKVNLSGGETKNIIR